MKNTLRDKFTSLKRDTKVFIYTLASGAVLSGIISLCIGLKQSVWFDEAYSILLAKHSFAEILQLTAVDTHPPLYYMILKVWAGAFGWSELALRSLSVLALVLSVVTIGLLARKMFGSRIAVGVIVVVAMSPLLLRYGFEIRMYSLATLIGVSATYCLYSAFKSRARYRLRWLIGYSLLVVVGMFTLYYLALLWLSHVAWLIYVNYKSKQMVKNLRPYVLAYVGSLVLFLPWIVTFFKQTTNGALAPIGQPMNYEQLSGVVSFNALYQPASSLNVITTAVLLAFIYALAWSFKKSLRDITRYRKELMLLSFYILVPVVFLMIMSLGKPMYTERYLSHVAIGLMALIGAIFTMAYHREKKFTKRCLLAVAILGTLLVGVGHLASVGNFNFQRNERPDVKQLAVGINNCASGTQLLAADPYVATELSYYLPNCEIYFVSPWKSLSGGYAPFSGSKFQVKDTELLTRLSVTYVYYGNHQPMPDDYHEIRSSSYGKLTVAEYYYTVNAE